MLIAAYQAYFLQTFFYSNYGRVTVMPLDTILNYMYATYSKSPNCDGVFLVVKL